MYKNEAAFLLIHMLLWSLLKSVPWPCQSINSSQVWLLRSCQNSPHPALPIGGGLHCKGISMVILLVSHPGLDLLFKFWHWFQHILRQRLTVEGVSGGVEQVPQDD